MRLMMCKLRLAQLEQRHKQLLEERERVERELGEVSRDGEIVSDEIKKLEAPAPEDKVN